MNLVTNQPSRLGQVEAKKEPQSEERLRLNKNEYRLELRRAKRSGIESQH